MTDKIANQTTNQSNNLVAMSVFNRQDYVTNHGDYVTWIDKIYECGLARKFNVGVLGVSIVIAIAVYTFGLLLAVMFGFQWVYVRTPAIFLAVFGIPWVLGCVHYTSKDIHPAFADLRLCVIIPDLDYKDGLDYWFKRLASGKFNFIGIAVLFICILLFVITAVFAADAFLVFGITAFRPSLFPTEWFLVSNRLSTIVILTYFGILVAMPLGTAGRLLRVSIGLVDFMRNLTVIPEPDLARSMMKHISDLFLFTSVTWFVGVALFGILFFDKIDIISILVLIGVSGRGVTTFLSPQIAFRTLLMDAYRRKSEYYMRLYVNQAGLLPDEPVNSLKLDEELTNKTIESLKKPRFWVFDISSISIVLISQIGIFISPLFGTLFGAVIGALKP